MIFGASLGPFVKKALENKAFQTNVNKIIEFLPQPPELSNMDAVVLGPKDMKGATGQALNEAVSIRHPRVAVFYFYMKDEEAELIGGDVRKIQAGKVTPDGIQQAVVSVIEMQAIGSDSRVLESADAKSFRPAVSLPGLPDEARTEAEELRFEESEAGAMPEAHREREAAREEAASASEAAAASAVDTSVADTSHERMASIGLSSEEVADLLSGASGLSIEAKLTEMGKFGDFDYFKRSLGKENVVSDLLRENTEYATVVNLLDVLDRRLFEVFKDTSLPPGERFERIKQIGVERAAYSGIGSSLLADKVRSIMEAVVTAAEATVEARIEQLRSALGTIADAKSVYEDRGRLDALIQSRLAIQADLMELSKQIIEVYMAMDRNVNELLTGIEDHHASENDYVNEIMKPYKPLLVPQNIGAVTNRLIGDLQRSRVALSIVEDKIKPLINLVFKLCEEDAIIIDYQQKLIQLLMAQRVEDVVVVDTLIKNSLRLFVGASDTGRTATAVTWSGIVARRHNTLLLDLTGQSKLRHYGMEPIGLEELLENRIERPFLGVEADLGEDLERVDQVVAELKTRLHYYANIHVILDASQTWLLDRLAASALSVHFITDCTPRGTEQVKRAIEGFKEDNIARKIVLIDPPIEPLRLLSELSVDPLTTKLIVLPRLNPLKACSLTRTRPYESQEITEVFEEAFR
ncbi:hypothetical protein [Cohnella fermenti]|uniref:Uncharacterized protein n=1 Tax=Cohnella fermenti TaxID=2565925 RepID=A0A4S4BHF3_9BACL|nr:hypothetical protein [Cohnella fermenti]THF73934.1 hypothetical protein E6C55_27070 [Cohnella fermenti]